MTTVLTTSTTPIKPSPSTTPIKLSPSTTPIKPSPSTTPIKPSPSTTPIKPSPSTTSTTPIKPSPSTTPIKPSPSTTSTTPIKPSPSTTPIKLSPSTTSTTPIKPSPSTTPIKPSPSTTPIKPSPSTTPIKPSPSTTPIKPSPSTTPIKPSPSTTPIKPSPSTTPIKLSPSTTSTTPIKPSPSTTPIKPSPSTTPIKPSPSTTPIKPSPSTTPIKPSPSTTPIKLSPSTTPIKPSPSTTPIKLSPSTTPIKPSPSTTPIKPSPSTTPIKPSPSTTPIKPSPSTTPGVHDRGDRVQHQGRDEFGMAAIISGVVAAIVVLLVLAIIAALWYRRRRLNGNVPNSSNQTVVFGTSMNAAIHKEDRDGNHQDAASGPDNNALALDYSEYDLPVITKEAPDYDYDPVHMESCEDFLAGPDYEGTEKSLNPEESNEATLICSIAPSLVMGPDSASAESPAPDLPSSVTMTISPQKTATKPSTFQPQSSTRHPLTSITTRTTPIKPSPSTTPIKPSPSTTPIKPSPSTTSTTPIKPSPNTTPGVHDRGGRVQYPQGRDESGMAAITSGVVAAIVVLLVLAIIAALWYRRRRLNGNVPNSSNQTVVFGTSMNAAIHKENRDGNHQDAASGPDNNAFALDYSEYDLPVITKEAPDYDYDPVHMESCEDFLAGPDYEGTEKSLNPEESNEATLICSIAPSLVMGPDSASAESPAPDLPSSVTMTISPQKTATKPSTFQPQSSTRHPLTSITTRTTPIKPSPSTTPIKPSPSTTPIKPSPSTTSTTPIKPSPNTTPGVHDRGGRVQYPQGRDESGMAAITSGVVAAIVVLLVLAIIAALWYRRRRLNGNVPNSSNQTVVFGTSMNAAIHKENRDGNHQDAASGPDNNAFALDYSEYDLPVITKEAPDYDYDPVHMESCEDFLAGPDYEGTEKSLNPEESNEATLICSIAPSLVMGPDSASAESTDRTYESLRNPASHIYQSLNKQC
ncbi:mucin-17-like [Nematostella vectensis]|uniref:mucin-17-like n=1 Tax=Nematostella vectensis TaxID=45351 RepID=UPI002076FDF8|nr:mucin-17-like [Nematostella vectensis]